MSKDSKKPIKYNKPSFQLNILLITTGLLIIIFVFFVLYNLLIYNLERSHKYIYIFSSVLLILLLSAIFFIFYKKVYTHTKNLENAVKLLECANTNISTEVLYNDDMSRFTDNLKRLLNRLKESMDKEHSAELLTHQAQFAALQSQINPHFLYNTLEVIRGQALIDGNYKISEMIEELAKYFRYNISLKNDMVTLEEELSNVKNYVTIQQYRFEDKFSFEIKYNDFDELFLKCKIPKLTLQPIVENAIYHGLETKLGKGKIVIHVTATDNRLIINVADDGIGMDDETLEKLNEKLRTLTGVVNDEDKFKHNGVAMINVNNRIKLFFGEDYGISISSTLSLGTEVEIVLPITFIDKNTKEVVLPEIQKVS